MSKLVNALYIDELQLAFEANQAIKLSSFRAQLRDNDNKHDDNGIDLAFYAQDGNDYAIVYNGVSYIMIAVSNYSNDDLGDVLCFARLDSFKEAVSEIAIISYTDYGED